MNRYELEDQIKQKFYEQPNEIFNYLLETASTETLEHLRKLVS